MFSLSLYRHIYLYLKSFFPEICFLFLPAAKTLAISCLDLHKLLLIGPFSSAPCSHPAKRYCQAHCPLLLFRLCSSHSAWASVHFPASPRLCTCLQLFFIPPTHPDPTPSFGPIVNSGILTSDPGTHDFRPTPRHPPQASHIVPINTAPVSDTKKSSMSSSFMKLASSNNCMLCAAFPQSIQESIACTVLFPVSITSRALYCLFWKNMISLLSDGFCSP